MKRIGLTVLLVLLLTSLEVQGQRGVTPRAGGTHYVYGDIKVNQGQASGKPISLDLVLFNEYGNAISRQRVSSNGRYRFIDLADGRYYIVVEFESNEITRITIDFSSPLKTDLQQDIELQMRDLSAVKTGVISAADRYDRGTKTAAIFSRASEAIQNKRYDVAISLLRQVVDTDPADFQAWVELGTAYFAEKNFDEAEKAYTQALKRKADNPVALISLGRLRIAQKNFDGAIEALTQAVKVQPTSPQANYFLGEAYLQIKKGSLGVGYLNEAIKLDPVGMADAHLRLATLYNAAGMKDKAAAEYEQFLKQRPDDPDRKKMEKYITENKKP
jgi:cytochrome c-type biogenesis protein CcmH/NrfG